jgi:hypothetical protein
MPEYQAIDLIKRLTLVLSTEKIAAIAWYEIKDLPKSDEVIGDEYNNRYLGVAYVDHTPKPAAKALQFFNQLFSSKNRCINSEITIERPLKSDIELHVFETEQGDINLVGWLKTVIPGQRGDDKSGNVKDDRSEKIHINIPKSLGGKATQYSELGEGSDFEGFEMSDNGIVIKDLEFRGGEVTIIQFKKD